MILEGEASTVGSDRPDNQKSRVLGLTRACTNICVANGMGSRSASHIMKRRYCGSVPTSVRLGTVYVPLMLSKSGSSLFFGSLLVGSYLTSRQRRSFGHLKNKNHPEIRSRSFRARLNQYMYLSIRSLYIVVSRDGGGRIMKIKCKHPHVLQYSDYFASVLNARGRPVCGSSEAHLGQPGA